MWNVEKQKFIFAFIVVALFLQYFVSLVGSIFLPLSFPVITAGCLWQILFA